MSYELLSHPADVRVRTTGPTLDAAFAEVVRAFAAVSESPGDTGSRHEVTVESEDREALLFDFLAELILLQQVDEVAVARAEDLTVTPTDGGYRLDATVLGSAIDDPLFDVKSPTYSGMRIEGTDDGWVVEATLDI